jgi:membrane-bound lytic murein transglycosylase A
MPNLDDDLGYGDLAQGLSRDIAALQARSDSTLQFGERRIAKADYIKALKVLIRAVSLDKSGSSFRRALRENFEAYEVYGRDDWGEVLVTSYFEPVIAGSRKKTKRFSQAIYGVPKDLVDVDLSSFANAEIGLSLPGTVLHARLVGRKVVAFPDRETIYGGALRTDASVLAWADPIDAFFLEIQGSGEIRFAKGKGLTVGYASQNGHPYVPIGRYLLDVIDKDKMSQQAIEKYLRSLPLDQAREILNRNPSFVFFQKIQGDGLTYLGSEVIPGRTIATDQRFFPKGALAFLDFQKPQFASPTDIEPSSWLAASRFVLDQDVGGAIRGTGRLDLYWGKGERAKQAAGVMRTPGRLVYFVPKN